MQVKYFNKQTKQSMQLSHVKRVLKSKCIKLAQYIGIASLLVALYAEFWIIAG